MPLFSHHMRPPRVDAASVDAEPPGATATSLLRRYRPLETRAAGGFGSVEICLDSRLQRRVAIKRMPLASRYSTAPAETRATALAEARTASMLQHPNIVSVIDFTYDAAYAYLVMEYIDGMTLEEFLEGVEGHSLTYDEAACLADALVQALAFAHENGVLHLDIKPANVLIDRSGHVKLTDFGMAALTSTAGFGDARGGTIGYMPPEQLAGEPVDGRTDLFALAAVLYESLCATAPFRAGTPADSLKKIKRGVLYPSDLLPDIPELAETALVTALSPRMEDRQESVAAFGDAFLAQLGNAREGRRSLARIIGRLTSDDADAPDADEPERAHRVWELDPARGYLGSRTPHARRITAGIISGASAWVTAWPLFVTADVTAPAALLSGTAAIALAAGVAPQLGSALVAAGFLALVMASTDLVAVLPAAAVALALIAGWWYAWGRASAGASAAFIAIIACALAMGDPLAGAGPVAAVAGYLLAPVEAAATIAVGVVIARLLAAALAAGGALTTAGALAALASPSLLIGGALAALTAAAASILLTRAWQRIQDGRGTGLVAAACAVAGIMVVLLLCVAHGMENPSSQALLVLQALGGGALSSILVWICTYALGYQKAPAEGDRS